MRFLRGTCVRVRKLAARDIFNIAAAIVEKLDGRPKKRARCSP
jgi:hypothetical protein